MKLIYRKQIYVLLVSSAFMGMLTIQADAAHAELIENPVAAGAGAGLSEDPVAAGAGAGLSEDPATLRAEAPVIFSGLRCEKKDTVFMEEIISTPEAFTEVRSITINLTSNVSAALIERLGTLKKCSEIALQAATSISFDSDSLSKMPWEKLISLRFEGMRLSSADMSSIADAISFGKLTNLFWLHLNNCGLGNEEISTLVHAISPKKLPMLVSLHLVENNIDLEGAQALVKTITPSNLPYLQLLNLQYNKIGFHNASSLAAEIDPRHLKFKRLLIGDKA